MTLGFNSQLNMLGMGSSMGYQNFLGGGLGMGMGGFNIGGMLGGCNMFQSCDGSYNYDAMAGYAVANVGVQCLFGFLGQAMSARKAKQADAPEAKLETLKTQQTELAGKLEKADTAYNTAREAYLGADGNSGAKKAYDDNQAILVGYNATEVAETIRLYKDYVETGNKYEGTTPLPDETAYKKALKQKEAKENESALKTAMEKARKAYEAAETAKSEAQSAYDTVTEQIDKLEAQLKHETTDKILDKADGHGYQQTKLTELNALFTVDGEGNEAYFSKDAKSTHKDIRGAVAQYRLAKSDTEKQKWATRISILWNNLSPEDQKNNKDIIAGIDAMRKNYTNLTFNNI